MMRVHCLVQNPMVKYAAVGLTRAYPDDVYYLKSVKTGIDIDFYNSIQATRFIIVTYEEEEVIHEDGITIEVVPLYKFLLELEKGRNYGETGL